ncbi:unnamed protein product, partial [Candidula unifasciata]
MAVVSMLVFFFLCGKCVKHCSTKWDCPKDECCADLTVPSNRAKRESFVGTCRRLGTANDKCYRSDSIDDDVNFLCPCGTGFYCQGGNQDEGEIPLGEP